MKGFSNESNALILATLEKMFHRFGRVNGMDLMSGKLNGRMLISMDYTGAAARGNNGQKGVILRRIAYDAQRSIVTTTEVLWTSADGERNITSKKSNNPASIIGYKFRLVPVAEEAALEKMIAEGRARSNPAPATKAEAPVPTLPSTTHSSGAALVTYTDNMPTNQASVQQIIRAIECARVETKQGADMLAELLSRIEANLEQQVEYSKEILGILRTF